MGREPSEWAARRRRFARPLSTYTRAGFEPACEHRFTVGAGRVLTGWPPLAVLAAERGPEAALAYTRRVDPDADLEGLAGLLGVPAAWLRGYTAAWFYGFGEWLDPDADPAIYAAGAAGAGEADDADADESAAGWEAGILASLMAKACRGLVPEAMVTA